MSNALIDVIFDNVKDAMDARDFLNSRARALRIVGMHDLANDLQSIGTDMMASAESIRDAFADHQNTQLKESQELTGNILLAAMKGCFVPAVAVED